MATQYRRIRVVACAGLAAAAMALAGMGCVRPLDRSSEQQLREQLIASHRAFLRAAADTGAIEVVREPSIVEQAMTPQRREELDAVSGPQFYRDRPADLGPNLLSELDTEADAVRMSLQRAIELALRHNLEIEQARLLPALGSTIITQAEALFDAVFFTNFDWQKLDTPRPESLIATFGATQSETTQLTTGLRKDLGTGGRIVAQTAFARNFADPSFFAEPPDTAFRYYDANVLLSISQPLLRGLGTDDRRAQIVLARSARDQAFQDFRRQLLEVLAVTERAYWDLGFALQRLRIAQRLLEVTIEDQEIIERRRDIDVSEVQLTQVNAFLEQRRAEMIQAQQDVRQASNQLKQLINAPDLPLAGETLILPIDEPADLPVRYHLLDAITTAIRHRPELIRALAQIEDTAVRLELAENGLLPVLNLTAAIRFNGVGDNVGAAYRDLTEGQFIDYIVGAQFEAPLGNRGPRAAFQQRQLERRAAVLAYQRAVQDVTLEVKAILEQMRASYRILGSLRSARRASADNLRALEVRVDTGEPLTPTFIDLRLQAQQRLADNTVREVRALADYNSLLARLHQATGTLLERNQIELEPALDDRPRR